ncbi:hypothetical protein APHAL10511_003949 [Amanita phalloides]|nr:hypothetical protein APHAL10511_003949 [Amanita phalloides]
MRQAQLDSHSYPTSFKIIGGTYEKLLYGLDVCVSASNDDRLQFTLSPIFAFPAHVSCIKAVAASPRGGKWLATGSADEIIKVWDLRRRKEVGGLMHHQGSLRFPTFGPALLPDARSPPPPPLTGSITHLHFPSRSHLLSASEDGTLCLFHARDWTVLRVMKGHKARINAVAIHPSGKVALSVGKDRTLRMWDFMRGKGVASTKLGKEGETVRWSTDGSVFVVQSGCTMDIYDVAMKLLHTITHPSRLHDVQFSTRASGQGQLLLAGAEDKRLAIYQISQDPTTPPYLIAEMIGHERRVKAIQTIAIQLPPALASLDPLKRKTTVVVCTVSSDGKIRVFDLASLPLPEEGKEGPVQIGPLAEYDTKGTRLTCIALADGDEVSDRVGKRQRERDDESEGGSNVGEEQEVEWQGLDENEGECD